MGCNRRRTAAMADWSSLPGDLISLIADRLLDSDDLDYYMDLRAVCRGWRSSTADPRSSPREPRFRPRQWAMLDEVHQSDARLFVNAGTGRFVRKDLALRRGYFVVAGAAGGLVVLADRTAARAARVLNPFTGAMVRFKAPVPSEGIVVAAAHVIGSSPMIFLLCGGYHRAVYWAWAVPGSKSFNMIKEHVIGHPLYRVAVEGGIYAAAPAPEDGSLESESQLLSRLPLAVSKILGLAATPFFEYVAAGDARNKNKNNRRYLVESAGEILIVFKLPRRFEVFKVDTEGNFLERVRNLGSRALFVGNCRCLSVDADKFTSVEPNCIYYVVEKPWRFDAYVYSIKEEETEVRAGGGGAIDSLSTIAFSVDPPFSQVQVLCCYTFHNVSRYS